MIDLEAVASAQLRREPFDWARVDAAVPAAGAQELLDTFPRDEFWELTHTDEERQWSYAGRPLITLGADRGSEPGELSAPWQELVDDLLSPGYRGALERLTGCSLAGASMEASIIRWDTGGHLSPHTDLAEKILTQVFYLSGEWDPAWGGDLCILGSASADDIVAELPPLSGLASVLVRSNRSWHSVAPIRSTSPKPRRNVLVTWHHAGAESVMWEVDRRGHTRCRASKRRASPPGGRPSTREPRVAMVGTFDVANLGDQLFPLVAERELSERLGPIELTLYSFREEPSEGHSGVRSLSRLPAEVAEYDLLLVGGGQIVRYDASWDIPGYGPDDPAVHDPLGLWLTPTLLASASGVPVAWNAPGVSAGLPGWMAPLTRAALGSARRVTVRDRPSAERLAAHAGANGVDVIPDTAFTVGRLLSSNGESRELGRLRDELGLGRGSGYVVVQASETLGPCGNAVRAELAAARERGLAVVALPVSPAHGDRPDALDWGGPAVSPRNWPAPLLATELLARAQTVIASAFHPGVIAVSSGVPLARPLGEEGVKYEALESLPNVRLLPRDGDGAAPEPSFGPVLPVPGQDEREARLDRYWDGLAAAVDTAAERTPDEAMLALLASLPLLLEDSEARADASERRVRDLTEHAARLEAVCNRRSARLGVAVADRVKRLRR